jgi:2-haloacid dehalogenase
LENGAIAQLGERFNGIEEVVGSIPSGSTNIQMTSSSSSASSAGSKAKLTDFKALTFDCYGTLIDWESGMIEALKPLTSKASRPLKRDEILEAHARHESSQQVQTPAKLYRDLLATVYRRLAEEWGVAMSWSDCVAYGRSVGNWPAFADTVASLQYLKRHYKLAILSNVDNESFSFSNEKLGVELDAVYTAEDCGSYKPSSRNFEYMLAKLKTIGIEKNQILHTAESLFHDHSPANEHGLVSCWIDRRHGQAGSGATMALARAPRYDFRFDSLADLVRAHQQALKG